MIDARSGFTCEPCEEKPCGANGGEHACDCACHGVWTYRKLRCPMCSEVAVHVFLESEWKIECSCGYWFEPMKNVVPE